MSMIIAFHSFRGGTGKSSIAVNVATQLALKGKRVGLVDTDILSPGIYVHFQMDENVVDRTLNDYLLGRCTIDRATYDVSHQVGLGTGASSGGCMYLVPTHPRAGEIMRIMREGYDVSRLSEGFQDLIEGFALEYLLLDTHPGWSEEAFVSMAISDLLFLILRPDQKDYLGTAITTEVARSLDIPHVFLIVNKALSRYDFDELRRKVVQAYACSVVTVLPLSEDVADMASAGIFSLHDPGHPFSQGVSEIVGCIEAQR